MLIYAAFATVMSILAYAGVMLADSVAMEEVAAAKVDGWVSKAKLHPE